MTIHLPPIDREAIRFRADMETIRYTAARIFGHRNINAVNVIPLLCDLEEETRHVTGINPDTLFDGTTP